MLPIYIIHKLVIITNLIYIIFNFFTGHGLFLMCDVPGLKGHTENVSFELLAFTFKAYGKLRSASYP